MIDYNSIEAEYLASIRDPGNYFANLANTLLTWQKPFSQSLHGNFSQGEFSWFHDGKLNVCENCIDRHLASHADKTAIIFQGDQPDDAYQLSYAELHQQVCQFANVLISFGIKKGDRVCIYMPMIVQASVAMLACARIGAIHSVVFAGFSAHALADRVNNAKAKCIITADQGKRGGKLIALKDNVDEAVKQCPSIEHVLVIRHVGEKINWQTDRDIDFNKVVQQASGECPAVEMQAEDPLFILYTSGSTGKPKGVLHTSAGYLLYASLTHQRVFDLRDDDIFWCTADVGWITGHSYVVYGPLANASTILIYEGVPNYPDVSRFWEIIDKHQVSIFYTAPTALRSLMRYGNAPVLKYKRSSLRILGTVGEPINPEVWQWYHDVVGNRVCPIVDTWWQTETGGAMIAPLAGITVTKPGSACKPFFGIEPALMDENHKEIQGPGQGKLVIKQPWPGQMRTVYADHQRFIDTYLSEFPGYYYTGDLAKRDEEGYYWIIGRADDVLNVSGHRIGTAEIESALVLNDAVAEAAVVGVPDKIKGQAVYAFVTLMQDIKGSDTLKQTLNQTLRDTIGPVAKCDYIQWTNELPKTRSGKIMRRILRNIVTGHPDELGDTSTLADPNIIQTLIDDCQINLIEKE